MPLTIGFQNRRKGRLEARPHPADPAFQVLLLQRLAENLNPARSGPDSQTKIINFAQHGDGHASEFGTKILDDAITGGIGKFDVHDQTIQGRVDKASIAQDVAGVMGGSAVDKAHIWKPFFHRNSLMRIALHEQEARRARFGPRPECIGRLSHTTSFTSPVRHYPRSVRFV